MRTPHKAEMYSFMRSLLCEKNIGRCRHPRMQSACFPERYAEVSLFGGEDFSRIRVADVFCQVHDAISLAGGLCRKHKVMRFKGYCRTGDDAGFVAGPHRLHKFLNQVEIASAVVVVRRSGGDRNFFRFSVNIGMEEKFFSVSAQLAVRPENGRAAFSEPGTAREREDRRCAVFKIDVDDLMVRDVVVAGENAASVRTGAS